MINGFPPPIMVTSAVYHILREIHPPLLPKAAECLAKDGDALLTFYDFPAQQLITETNSA